MKKIQVLVFIIGVCAFGILIYWAGIDKILAQLEQLGFSIIIILMPYIAVLTLDTLGWKYVIISENKRFNILQLFTVKVAGDFVNNITPAGAIAGEPVKAHILKHYGVSFLEGIASVYMNKLLMAKGQLLFVLLGLILAFTLLFDQNQMILIGGGIVFVLFTIIILIFYYLGSKKGIFNVFLAFLDKINLNFSFIERQREQLNLFDEKVSYFYKNHRREFLQAIISFFAAWVFGAVELYLALNFLGVNVSFAQAWMLESLSTVIRGLTFFVPGGWGTLEGGFILLFSMIGPPLFPDMNSIKETAMSYSVIRRIREFLWLGVGMFFLARFNLELPKIISKRNNNKELTPITPNEHVE